MRKTREEKAITLIALIITIVVLLILAVVAINAVTGDGIIQHATNAKTQYEKAQAEENSILSYYETYLNIEGQVGKWTQKEETKTVKDINGNNVQVKIPASTITKVNKDGTVINIPIGAIVNYIPTDLKEGVDNSKTSYISVGDGNTLVKDSTTGNYKDQEFNVSDYTGKWKVLGIENGKILLISADSIKEFEMNRGQQYIIGENELNNICKIYGNGIGAESARSIKVEDVNKITGYNPEVFIYQGDDTYGKYGVKTTYTYDGTNVKAINTEGEENTFSENKVIRVNEDAWTAALNKNLPYEVINGYYTYTGAAYDDRINMNMDKNSEEYKILFINDDYWLASRRRCVLYEGGNISNQISFGLSHVTSGSKSGAIADSGSTGTVDTQKSRGVRPVVTLEANADLVLRADGSYDIKL